MGHISFSMLLKDFILGLELAKYGEVMAGWPVIYKTKLNFKEKHIFESPLY